MSYQTSCVVNFAESGLTVYAQLFDSDGAAYGSEITTGIVNLEVGGNPTRAYQLVATVPDGFVGSCLFYENGDVENGAAVAISPQETENADAKTSTRSTVTTAQVNAEVDTALSDVGLTSTVTGRVDAAISSRSSHSASDVVTALMAHALESGKSVQVALLDIWSVIVGDAAGDSASTPTSITYDSPDGTVQITHTLTTTTRAVS